MKKTFIGLGLLLSVSAYMGQQTLTTNFGAPVGDNQNSLTVGNNGAVLLQDIHLVEKLAAFDRERIPERVVHPRGAGAYGEFECKVDMSPYTKARLFSEVGVKTPVFVRFSTVIHGTGSPETLRDPRGFATKFYTKEGNYDIVGNNLPVFFIRDAIKFPDMVHSLKPSPITNRQDPNRYLDFFSHIPESTHMLMRLYSDYGIPANYREMDGSSVHAFKWINNNGEVVYVKYTWKSKQGERNLSMEEASKIQGMDFQHATTDLYDNIKKGNYPQWDLYVQILKPSDFDKLDYFPLDATKIWNETDAKPMLIGTMTLNKIPDNYFEHVEQSAFSPGTLIPGIEPSEDKLLQGRLFSYFDTQRHRVGANFQKLAVNRPIVSVNSNNQDGPMSERGTKSDTNYQPSRINNKPDDAKYKQSKREYSNVFITQDKIDKPNDFKQAGDFYRSLDKKNQENLLKNLLADLKQVTNKDIQKIITGHFYMADNSLGKKIASELKLTREDVESIFHKKYKK
ncbi:catalase [Riemerella anatipestifer]|uniref:Catalase n=3 Tax=Riemerella anatipestifer TaxID=34085 RepID=E4TAY4_RIEAD|nr:catalase [Riemerella anatipestifer]ADQ81220.1 Catalase [Riemerella anatipestifer ATCC 11845 = DSM 15868]AFD55251.1 Catalase [Riemerella anatipestifer ATCC 11845 = DSM 15868]AGC40896.1 Catalase [Riemerella anatipestifer RA-CH-2]AKP68529.1 catalase [Riemerella anatipestifer]AKQ38789.1 catalase [Riemerella anatipestifer Yb2]